MFFLIDCDNFFASCETIFRPDLKGKPLIILSNNDGCVVSRSYEAKALGIPMCAPYFKISREFERQGGIALSSNYELYANISKRLMNILHQEVNNLEIYSIDEAFTEISGHTDYLKFARHLRQRILRDIGISVSIGIAPTKTLCKIASEKAKKKNCDKIYFLETSEQIRQILQTTEIENIWGIGKNLSSKLNFMGIFTGSDLIETPQDIIRRKFGITLEKTMRELQGIPCLKIEENAEQKSIISSRSFDHEINQIETLEKIISEFVEHAALRLRQQKSLARNITVFIKTNRFNTRQEQQNSSITVDLGYPCNHTGHFIQAMKKGLKQIYQHQTYYKSAGVILSNISDEQASQKNLFEENNSRTKEIELMKAFDHINQHLGAKSLFFGEQAPQDLKFIKKEFRSQAYTTSWNELPTAK